MFFSISILLSLAVPAHFIQKYSLYTVRRGDPAILTCEAFGTPPISIRWLKQDVKTGVAIPLRIPIFGTTEFDDMFGSDQFDIGKTDLGARTAFDNSRRNINADDDITISDNNININNLDDDITSSSRWNAFQRDFPISRIQEEEERTVFELHISTTEMKDSAVYTCRISNEYGDDVRNMELTIFGKYESFYRQDRIELHAKNIMTILGMGLDVLSSFTHCKERKGPFGRTFSFFLCSLFLSD